MKHSALNANRARLSLRALASGCLPKRVKTLVQIRSTAVLVAAALCFSHLHQGSLMIDSVRYAHIAHLMEQRGDWFYLYDEFNDSSYSNKPPLLFWLVALSIKAQGLSVFSAKLPAVLFVFVALLLLWDLSARLYGVRAAFLSLLLFSCNRVFFRSVVDLNFEGMLLCGAVCCLRSYVLLIRGKALGKGGILVFLTGLFFILMAKPPYLLFLLLPGLLVLMQRPSLLSSALRSYAAGALLGTLFAGFSWMSFMSSADISQTLNNQLVQPMSISGSYLLNIASWGRALLFEFAPLSWVGVLALVKANCARLGWQQGTIREKSLYYSWLLPILPITLWMDYQSRYLAVPLLPLALLGGQFLARNVPAVRVRHWLVGGSAASFLAFLFFGLLNLPVHQQNRGTALLAALPPGEYPQYVCMSGHDSLATKPTRKRMGMLIELGFGYKPEVVLSTTLGRTSAASGDSILAERGCLEDLRHSGVSIEMLQSNGEFAVIRLKSGLSEASRSGKDDRHHSGYH